jgi:hypothetical protein
MAVKYFGIQLTAPAGGAPFTADQTLWGFDVVVTNTSGIATITGANGVVMAAISAGQPLRLGGTAPVAGEPIQLSQYSAQAAAGNVHIAFAVRTT